MSRPGALPDRWISGRIVHETDKAILFNTNTEGDDDTEEDIWIPLSQISQIKRAPKESGAVDELKCTDWILRQKGL